MSDVCYQLAKMCVKAELRVDIFVPIAIHATLLLREDELQSFLL